MHNRTKTTLISDILIVVIDLFVLLFQYKQLVLHNMILFVSTIFFIALSVVVLIILNNTSKTIIIPRSDCIWIKGKISVGVLSIAISVILLNNYWEILSNYILFESIPLFVLGSIAIISARNTFIGASLFLSFSYIVLSKVAFSDGCYWIIYLFFGSFYVLTSVFCSIDNREKFLSFFEKPPKDIYKFGGSKNGDYNELIKTLNNDRITAITIDYPYPLKIFYICNEGEIYKPHVMSDGTICYTDNYRMIKSFVYTRGNEYYKKMSDADRKKFVESVKTYLDKNIIFIKCRYYNHNRISGYRKRYPGE